MIVRFWYLESVLLRLCVKEFEVRIRSRRFKEHSVSKLTPSGGVGRSVRNHPKKRKRKKSERAVFFTVTFSNGSNCAPEVVCGAVVATVSPRCSVTRHTASATG